MNAVPPILPFFLALLLLCFGCVTCFLAEVAREARTQAEIETERTHTADPRA